MVTNLPFSQLVLWKSIYMGVNGEALLSFWRALNFISGLRHGGCTFYGQLTQKSEECRGGEWVRKRARESARSQRSCGLSTDIFFPLVLFVVSAFGVANGDAYLSILTFFCPYAWRNGTVHYLDRYGGVHMQFVSPPCFFFEMSGSTEQYYDIKKKYCGKKPCTSCNAWYLNSSCWSWWSTQLSKPATSFFFAPSIFFFFTPTFGSDWREEGKGRGKWMKSNAFSTPIILLDCSAASTTLSWWFNSSLLSPSPPKCQSYLVVLLLNICVLTFFSVFFSLL